MMKAKMRGLGGVRGDSLPGRILQYPYGAILVKAWRVETGLTIGGDGI